MSDETSIDRQKEGGASVRMEDSRVSKIRDWVWGVIGTGLIGTGLLAANNLYELNLTVARGVANDAIAEGRYQDHEARLRAVEREVSTIEGRNMRGAPENQHGR